METFGDPNCHSMSDSFSLYERYLRSFNVVNSFIQENHNIVSSPRSNPESCEGNIDLSDTGKHCETSDRNPLIPDANQVDKVSYSLDTDYCAKVEENITSSASPSLHDNSWITADHSLFTEKSDATDVPVSSEDSKSNYFKNSVFISSTMENSNNAVDSVPLFRGTNPSETIFKLPIRELSFNGTIKHVQKLKPIVDPITALTSEAVLSDLEEKVMEHPLETYKDHISEAEADECGQKSSFSDKTTESSECSMDHRVEKCSESMGDSQYEELNGTTLGQIVNDDGTSNMNCVTSGIANDDGSSNMDNIEACETANSYGSSSIDNVAVKVADQIVNDDGSSNMNCVTSGIANDDGSSNMDNIEACETANSYGSSDIDNVAVKVAGQIVNDDASSNMDSVTKCQITTDERSSNMDSVTTGQLANDDMLSTIDIGECSNSGQIANDYGSSNTDDVKTGQIAIDDASSTIDNIGECSNSGQRANDYGSSNTDDVKTGQIINDDGSSNVDHSYSSMEESFDSGVRSPDVFSEDDIEAVEAKPTLETFWSFLKDFEAYDKKRLRKLEETLQGILPPPSVTTLKTDVTEMLKKYYGFLPLFNGSENEQSTVLKTPSKRVSFVHIPSQDDVQGDFKQPSDDLKQLSDDFKQPSDDLKQLSDDLKLSSDDCSKSIDSKDKTGLNTSDDKSFELKLSTELEMKETPWPDILKYRYYDVNYNISSYGEHLESSLMRYGERYVGAETETSLTVWSGGLQSPTSACKRKAQRLKMAQAKSPGRRLSHLARRRQAFASAATVGEKAHSAGARMVLIDKKKLVSSSERKSPRVRRTPGKKTPTRKTPGKKTPRKTPKSGGSSKKKAMRRLLMESDSLTRSQPSQNTIKRALFISPDNRKSVPQVPSSSVPVQAMKSKRALFSSPVTAETKSLDGTASDQFMKRKLSALDDQPETSRSKMAKSLSFGGDTVSNRASSSQQSFSRRASEFFATKNSSEFSEVHKKKLLWAVSEALRVHGWRMSSPGFREKASALARLTRRLLALPAHAARLAQPNTSTSDTMLKLARQYVFAIIQGRTVEECCLEEQAKLNSGSAKVTGYISAAAYQQMKSKPSTSTCTSQVKENLAAVKQEQPRSNSNNILQDKLVNIDTNSNSSSGFSMIDKSALFKSNSMPSFEAAKLRARRQISFDNVDFPKR